MKGGEKEMTIQCEICGTPLSGEIPDNIEVEGFHRCIKCETENRTGRGEKEKPIQLGTQKYTVPEALNIIEVLMKLLSGRHSA